MKCEEVMELMQRSLDGDLDKAETSRMKEHIQACPECAAMYARLTLLSDNLAQLPRVAPSFSIVDSILPQLEKIELAPAASRLAPSESGDGEQSLPSRARASRPSARKLYRRLAGAIAAGIAAGLLIVSWPNLQSSHSDQDRSFDAASLSSPAASASPSAAASDRVTTKLFNKQLDSGEASSGSASQEDAAQPPTVSGSAQITQKSILPNTDYAQNSPQASSGQAGASEPDAAPSEEIQPKASLAAPSEGGATGAQASPSASPGLAGAMAYGPSSVWMSPDGKYRAAVEDNRLKVYQTSDDSLLFESDEHPDSTIADVVWDDDSAALHYAWTDASGESVKLVWTAASGQESAADSGASEDRE